nr:hypothetical protein [Mesorhizobium sp. M2A.F.Ca.ET.043.05.1.1]
MDGKTVKVIDFDDCGFGWFMYDAATPISFYEHEPQATDLIQSWTTGYRRVLDLPRRTRTKMPTFVMLRRLLLVAGSARTLKRTSQSRWAFPTPREPSGCARPI